MTIKLWNYKPFAPASPWGSKTPRGYSQELLLLGVAGFLKDHHRMEDDLPWLGLMPWCPGGRDRHAVAWKNGFTKIRSDQISRALAGGFGWVIRDLVAARKGRERRTQLYVGGHPEWDTLTELGLMPWLRDGYTIALDALSSQPAVSGLVDSVIEAHDDGLRVVTESNSATRRTDSVPVIASDGDWAHADRRPDRRTPMGLAPARSQWWWRTEDKDGPWSIERARVAVGHGLTPNVQLDRLTDAQRDELFELVEAA